MNWPQILAALACYINLGKVRGMICSLLYEGRVTDGLFKEASRVLDETRG